MYVVTQRTKCIIQSSVGHPLLYVPLPYPHSLPCLLTIILHLYIMDVLLMTFTCTCTCAKWVIHVYAWAESMWSCCIIVRAHVHVHVHVCIVGTVDGRVQQNALFVMLMADTNIAKSRDLGTWVSCKRQSICQIAKNWLQSMHRMVSIGTGLGTWVSCKRLCQLIPFYA